MSQTASHLSETARISVSESLQVSLYNGIDLYTQIKVAHWNIKGVHFISLHPFFDSLASDIAKYNDDIAERAVILGFLVKGTSRSVASNSKISEYPQNTTRDLEHVKLLSERVTQYLNGLKENRSVAESHSDTDTTDLLAQIISETEKHAWFLLSTIAG